MNRRGPLREHLPTEGRRRAPHPAHGEGDPEIFCRAALDVVKPAQRDC
jgi:hypothetical protein